MPIMGSLGMGRQSVLVSVLDVRRGMVVLKGHTILVKAFITFESVEQFAVAAAIVAS